MEWYRISSKTPRNGEECAFRFRNGSVEIAIFIEKRYKAVWKFKDKTFDVRFNQEWLPLNTYHNLRLRELNANQQSSIETKIINNVEKVENKPIIEKDKKKEVDDMLNDPFEVFILILTIGGCLFSIYYLLSLFI